MCVVGALFLLTVDRNLGRVHIQHRPRGPLLSFGPGNHIPAHGRKPVEVRSLRQHLSLKPMEPRGRAAPRSRIFSEPIRRKVGS